MADPREAAIPQDWRSTGGKTTAHEPAVGYWETVKGHDLHVRKTKPDDPKSTSVKASCSCGDWSGSFRAGSSARGQWQDHLYAVWKQARDGV